MLKLDENNLQNYKFTVDEDKLNNILDMAISNDSSLIVGKLPIEEPIAPVVVTPQASSQDGTNVLALTVRGDYNLSIAKNAFFKTIRMSLKVAFSTFFLNVARIFLGWWEAFIGAVNGDAPFCQWGRPFLTLFVSKRSVPIDITIPFYVLILKRAFILFINLFILLP